MKKIDWMASISKAETIDSVEPGDVILKIDNLKNIMKLLQMLFWIKRQQKSCKSQ